MDRRYFVVLGALLTQFMIIGLFFVYSLLIKELELEFGWSRTTFRLVPLSSDFQWASMPFWAVG